MKNGNDYDFIGNIGPSYYCHCLNSVYIVNKYSEYIQLIPSVGGGIIINHKKDLFANMPYDECSRS